MRNEDLPFSRDELIKIEGAIEEIVYRNDENGYTVAVMEWEREPLTVVGIMPGLRLGNEVSLLGKWVNHPVYGRQFSVSVFELVIPHNTDGILKYLSSRAIKGVGPKTAKRIVDQFGDTSFDVLENSPELLSTVRGISREKAEAICKSFREQFGLRNVMMFFGDYFGPATSMKIFKCFGSNAVEIIKTNPYLLCEEIHGIGFERADKLAMSMGISPDAPGRIESGIIYLLNYNSISNGHVYLPLDSLCQGSARLLGVDESAVESAIDRLCNMGRLVKRDTPEHVAVYTKRAFDAENKCIKKLELLRAINLYGSVVGAESLIEEIQLEDGISYAAAQKNAIISAINNSLTIITGGPGTGKTTIIRAALKIFLRLGLKVSLAAPTGRAAKRMSEATQANAKTVHRLLEMEFSETDEPKFFRGEDNPLDSDVVIVDEVSMIDVFLFSSLLSALKPGTRLILIGDSDQLPSVGAGDVLRDMIGCGKYSVCRLDTVFRQASESAIIVNAHRINRGEYPQKSDKNGDFFIMERKSSAATLATVVELCASRLKNTYGADVMEGVQILSCTRKGELGTYNLNAVLQNTLNPPDSFKKEHKSRDRVFRVGDKVMQISNNYDLSWYLEDEPDREGAGVFNGDIGTVISIDEDEEMMVVNFDGRICSYEFSSLDELEHAWAITVHKAQGSEYPIVIMPVYEPSRMLATRNLLYTAITRAQKMVILVGNSESVNRMVDTDRVACRYTGLGKEF